MPTYLEKLLELFPIFSVFWIEPVHASVELVVGFHGFEMVPFHGAQRFAVVSDLGDGSEHIATEGSALSAPAGSVCVEVAPRTLSSPEMVTLSFSFILRESLCLRFGDVLSFAPDEGARQEGLEEGNGWNDPVSPLDTRIVGPWLDGRIVGCWADPLREFVFSGAGDVV